MTVIVWFLSHQSLAVKTLQICTYIANNLKVINRENSYDRHDTWAVDEHQA